MQRAEALLIFLLLGATFATIVPTGSCQSDLSDVLNEILTSPAAVLLFLVQFGLGLGLGYFSVKAVKYIIAVLAIIGLGILLNIWRFGGFDAFLRALGWGGDFTQIIGVLTTIVALLGILTLLPVGVGFLVGAIVAVRK